LNNYSYEDIETTTDISILEQYSNYHSAYLINVAANESCPAYILEKLSDISYVKIYIASNPNCPTHILEKLCFENCDDFLIKIYVVKNKNCTYDILKKLYKDINYSYKAHNHKIKRATILKYIKEHPNWKLNEFE